MNKMEWRVNTPQLIHEIAANNNMSVLKQPLNILQGLLKELTKRAIELNDIELNKIMLRMSLYDIANPESKYFDQEAIDNYLKL